MENLNVQNVHKQLRTTDRNCNIPKSEDTFFQ